MAACSLNISAFSYGCCLRSFNGLKANSSSSLRPAKGAVKSLVAVRRSVRPLKISCQSTLDEVQDIIASQLSVGRDTVQPHTKFSDLGADSLDTVEIVMTLEEKFGVTIAEQDAENLSTVQQVADLIEKQRVSA